MSDKIGVIWPLEPHTEAKHDILRYYLGAWFPILATTRRRLLYVDGFAGPGEYEGGKDGSPIIALKVASDHVLKSKLQRSGMELVFLFIEEDAARFQNLEGKIATLNLPSNFRIIKECDCFASSFGKVLTEIEQQSKQLAAGAIALSESAEKVFSFLIFSLS